ncbi:GNAT family N-acetyltransferase [Rubrivirga sp. S365]|uniref:GNAT family N-acetyltransferase n=1 Tax=Rubrivirga litoralis TaxID=3075598 RepID=A0ABU3BS98_9BACT|nr:MULTISPECIES: GNAT family N-acetyltransferase [unclassified Rubrivirga]MDT0632175.1 GNAT family N-acetyltransferase [Rubrivirga sp. F394]MDT7856785.1 GNAT family N-acetyltransferase [Rubrivirga sp. S365]
MTDPGALVLRDTLDGLTPGRIATLYRRAPLLRKTDNPEALRRSFENSSLVLSLWEADRLVGLARVLTDGEQMSYLCDLAVEPDLQGSGVGKRLVDEVLERCKGTELVLRDSDISAGFYERLGFEHVENAWVRKA